MAARSRRMRVVLQMAEREEQSIVEQLNQQREQLQREREQLQQLQDYRTDYCEQIRQRTSGLLAQAMARQQQFLARLQYLEGEQEQRLAMLQRGIDGLQVVWQQRHQYRKAIEELIVRLQNEEDAVAEKQLQRLLDDLAAQKK